ncbi:GNAT family N-acetyltransferase [Dyella acidiphila]|uniref:GNAT family N-acetyltransferase n=1 Tax=Dyella acidiphila TaxID=2775866 RepID=A0ABR9GAR4_9GAMM|nr:GNAT family N-acetyltransferase [Dyella acidiphila]MBE1161121.1 GNAT family N-acetyltransferase [Dyella acidiphila]
MQDPIIDVTDQLDQYAMDVIGSGLNAFNDENTGINDRLPLGVLVKDPASGKVVGGVTGRTSLGLLFLDVFYLPKEYRQAGLGSRILQLAENEGRRRGCCAAVLYTINFQAPGFYERHGWRRFGEIPCLPPGTSRIFMTKDL